MDYTATGPRAVPASAPWKNIILLSVYLIKWTY
jgi:hypothetical protein